MGVAPIAAHLFAFYFGLVSAITPPVALAAFAAAGIAGSNPMVTGVHSFRLGIAKYVLPFVFVFSPGMVFEGNLASDNPFDHRRVCRYLCPDHHYGGLASYKCKLAYASFDGFQRPIVLCTRVEYKPQ